MFTIVGHGVGKPNKRGKKKRRDFIRVVIVYEWSFRCDGKSHLQKKILQWLDAYNSLFY
jgi:hypothetical protein